MFLYSAHKLRLFPYYTISFFQQTDVPLDGDLSTLETAAILPTSECPSHFQMQAKTANQVEGTWCQYSMNKNKAL